MRPITRALLVVLAVPAVMVLVAGAITLGSLPKHDGTIRLAGLEAPVTIRRDEHAVPYIEARSEADGYFALGFVHAQDRLWQMEQRRRIAQGRLAELVGAPALEIDRLMRLLRVHALAERSLDALKPDHRALVAAYTAGVNAYLGSNGRLLPPEFWLLWHRPEPWTDADSVAWVKLMALDLAGNWRRELLRARLVRALPPELYADLFPFEVAPSDVTLSRAREALLGIDLEALAQLLGPPAPTGHGSNAWVVAGERSTTGAPLLANDPHLSFIAPGTWYLAGLRTPEIEVVGATLPGMPVFVLGRTDRFAWGMTNTGSDVQDLVVEELVGTGPAATRTPDGTAPVVAHESVIRCRFCDDEPFVARWSINGPLLSDLVGAAAAAAGPGRALALRWSALEPEDTPLAAGFDVPHATSWETFDEAFRRFTNPQQNVFYADTDGRIGLVVAGKVPIRRSGDGTLPVMGWERDGAWSGFVPYEDLPRRVDPPAGFLANANNAVADASYPHLLSRRWDAPWRYRRIVDRLDAQPHDVASFEAMQRDVRSGAAAALLPSFLQAAPVAGEAAAWLHRLRDWDREASTSAREQTVFAAWYAALPEHLYADELGAAFAAYGRDRPLFIEHALNRAPAWCDDVTTVDMEDCPLILARALATGLDRLEAALGPEGPDWAWGRQHPLIFEHGLLSRLGPLRRLAEIRLAGGGDETTLNAASYALSAEPPLFPSYHGASYRQVVDLADMRRSRFAAPMGQVGHPASRHYRDLQEPWAEGSGLLMAPPQKASAILDLAPR